LGPRWRWEGAAKQAALAQSAAQKCGKLDANDILSKGGARWSSNDNSPLSCVLSARLAVDGWDLSEMFVACFLSHSVLRCGFLFALRGYSYSH